jgi:hypothetical protein
MHRLLLAAAMLFIVPMFLPLHILAATPGPIVEARNKRASSGM